MPDEILPLTPTVPWYRKPAVFGIMLLLVFVVVAFVASRKPVDEPPKVEAPKPEVVAQATPQALPPPPPMFSEPPVVSPAPSSAWKNLPLPPAPKPAPKTSVAAAPVAAAPETPFRPFPAYVPPPRDKSDWVEKTLNGEEE